MSVLLQRSLPEFLALSRPHSGAESLAAPDLSHFGVNNVSGASRRSCPINLCVRLLSSSCWLTSIITEAMQLALGPRGTCYRSVHQETLTPSSDHERTHQTAGVLLGSGFLSGMCHVQGLFSRPPVFELSASQIEKTRGVWTESTLEKTTETVWRDNCLLIEVFNCLVMIKPVNILCFPFLTDPLHFSDTGLAGRAFVKCGDKDSAILLQRVWLTICSVETKGKSYHHTCQKLQISWVWHIFISFCYCKGKLFLFNVNQQMKCCRLELIQGQFVCPSCQNYSLSVCYSHPFQQFQCYFFKHN